MNCHSKIKVMIVDDSIVVRGLLRHIIEKDADIEISTTAVDGEEAFKDYMKYHPDIVLMDVEMPNMNGLETLQKILQFDPKAKVIMCSSVTQRGAEITYRALQIGAADFLTKPSSKSIDRSQTFANQLIEKIRNLSGKHANLSFVDTNKEETIHLQEMPSNLPNNFPVALFIGSSTGGPKALIDFLKNLNKNLLLPIFITQHIPAGFSESLATTIQNQTGYPVREAAQDMLIEPGHIYLAPGHMHMGVQKTLPRRIELIDSVPVNYCKPSIDVMLESADKAYGSNMILVMLTGMGSDGKNGCANLLKNEHNILLAQDKESSIVWGIPGAVAKAGLCHYIATPSEIAAKANKLIKRDIS
jgi:two-component system, chemotaxis family, protein-glutamate methylesterase/glutaminase